MAGEIFIADKATLDAVKTDTDLIKGYVDTVETTLGTANTNINTISTNVNTANTKLGTNVDAAGSTTVFARLKQIYDYIVAYMSSTRMAKIDNLDAAMSTRAAATSLTALDAKVGVANPTTADATTVMNYLKKLDTKGGGVDWTKNVPFNALYKTPYGIDTAPKTVCNITGKGYVTKILSAVGENYPMHELKVTIDGVVVAYYKSLYDNGGSLGCGLVTVEHRSSTLSATSDKHYYGVPGALIGGSAPVMVSSSDIIPTYPSSTLQSISSYTGLLLELAKPIFFNSSLKVEVIKTATDRNGYVNVHVIGGLLA